MRMVETFTCGALVEMLIPSDRMEPKRRNGLKRNCASIDLLIRESMRGGNLGVLANKREIYVSFSCESFDTMFIEEAWKDILCNAEGIILRNMVDNLILEIHLSSDLKPDRDDGQDWNLDETDLQNSQNIMQVFMTLKESINKKLKEDGNPCRINEKRLREVSGLSLELIDCIRSTGASVQVDEYDCDMINIEIWGETLHIMDPFALYEISKSGMGFYGFVSADGLVHMETTYNNVLLRG